MLCAHVGHRRSAHRALLAKRLVLQLGKLIYACRALPLLNVAILISILRDN